MSAEIGRKLPHDRRTLIFFSFVSRCYQTADEIRKGIVENGGVVEDFDALTVLVSPEVKNQEFWNYLHPDGKNITDFVNQWADGVFGDMVEDFDEYRIRLLNDTVRRIQAASRNSMHIHITHDLALMAAKRILLNRAVDLQDREPFLGGIGILLDDDELILYSSGRTISLDGF